MSTIAKKRDSKPRPATEGRQTVCCTWPADRWENNLLDAIRVIKIWMDADGMRAQMFRELHRWP